MLMVLSRQISMKPYFSLVFGGKTVSEADKALIVQVQFEDSDVEAGLVRVTINDTDFLFSKTYNLNKKTIVEVDMGYEKFHEVVMRGEITHYEASFDENGIQQLVVGITDKSNRMNTVKKSRTWKNKKKSDVVLDIAREYGLKAIVQDTIEVLEQVSQDNETDASFIRKLADDEAYEFFILPIKHTLFFGNVFDNIAVEDILSYKTGDHSVRFFNPSYIERVKENESTKDVSDITGATVSGTSINVSVIDPDKKATPAQVAIVGKTGAVIKK